MLTVRVRIPSLVVLACVVALWMFPCPLPSSLAQGHVPLQADMDVGYETTMRLAAVTNEESFVQAEPSISGHPLEPAIRFAKVRYEYLRKHVRDFSCLLIRRERINGYLRDYEYVWTRVRMRRSDGSRPAVPLSVYMEFLKPAQYRGRKVLYVEGQNEGKMLVRNGGRRFSYVTLRIRPDSETAMAESRYPITELSLDTVARRMIEKAEADMRADPAGENTNVTFYVNARVNDRPCTHIRVVHPQRDENLNFHVADVYVDDELHVPIRVEGYDWPADPDAEPVLLEEYTFTHLQLNLGLTDADFDPSLVSR